MRRLTWTSITGLVYVSGLEQAIREKEPVLPSLVALSSMCQGMYIHDKALVYAEVMYLLEGNNVPVPEVLEGLFFDRITQEIADGSERKKEGDRVRAAVRPLAEASVAIHGLPKGAGRDPTGEPGGRQGHEEDLRTGWSVQVDEEAEPTKSPGPGTGGGDYF